MGGRRWQGAPLHHLASRNGRLSEKLSDGVPLAGPRPDFVVFLHRRHHVPKSVLTVTMFCCATTTNQRDCKAVVPLPAKLYSCPLSILENHRNIFDHEWFYFC